MKEIGEIQPWFDKKLKDWVFYHPNYPVEYGGDSAEEVIKNYPKYLEEFIKHRLDKKLDEIVEKKTLGGAGVRTERPHGTN